MSKEGILLRSINTPNQETFQIDREGFVIGKGTEGTDGVISGVRTVSRHHLQADWKEGRGLDYRPVQHQWDFYKWNPDSADDSPGNFCRG